MPAFRARPVVAALVVSLASTACGGDDSPQPEQTADTSPTTTIASEADQETTAAPDPIPEVEQQPPDEPDPIPEAEQQEQPDPVSEPEAGQEDPTTNLSQEQADQPESTTTTTVATTTTTTTTTVPEPERLGDRFEWCGRVQIRWDRFDFASETLDVAAAELQTAEDVLAAATDELDIAEAKEAVEVAQQVHRDAEKEHDERRKNLLNYTLETRLAVAFPELAPGVVDWIEQIIREDEQFDADISLHNTGDRIEEEVAERMDRLAQGMDRITYTAWHERMEESELVAASRAWDTFDAHFGDLAAFKNFESDGVAEVVLAAYWNRHRRYADSGLEAARPANKLRFDETANSRLEANRATVGSEFLANDEAQLAYRDSYRESCRVT